MTLAAVCYGDGRGTRTRARLLLLLSSLRRAHTQQLLCAHTVVSVNVCARAAGARTRTHAQTRDSGTGSQGTKVLRIGRVRCSDSDGGGGGNGAVAAVGAATSNASERACVRAHRGNARTTQSNNCASYSKRARTRERASERASQSVSQSGKQLGGLQHQQLVVGLFLHQTRVRVAASFCLVVVVVVAFVAVVAVAVSVAAGNAQVGKGIRHSAKPCRAGLAALTLIFIDKPPNFQAVDLELSFGPAYYRQR